MNRLEFYKQCELEKDGNKQTAWIPTRGAVQGYSVELKEDGEFWLVKKVYDNLVEGATLKNSERNYLSHRKATDI